MTSRRLAICLLFIFLLGAGRLTGQCTVTVSPVAFGLYDVFNPAPTASTGSLSWSCSEPGLAIQIQLGPGSAGSYRPRRLASGAERLAYNLYLDAAATRIWGDGTGGTSILSVTTGTSPRAVSAVPLFGVIPPGQDAAPGIYTDTVVITVLF